MRILSFLFIFPAIQFISLFAPFVVSFDNLLVSLWIRCINFPFFFHLFKLYIFSYKNALGNTPTSIKLTYNYFFVKSISLKLHEMLVFSHSTISNNLFNRLKLWITNVIIKTESNGLKNWVKKIFLCNTKIYTGPWSFNTRFPKRSKYWPKWWIEKQLLMCHRL